MSLEMERLRKGVDLLIDPDNVFWGITTDERNNKGLEEIYNKLDKRLDTSMHDFRFRLDLNSVYINPTDRCNADCPYCYIPAYQRKSGTTMTNKQLLYVLNKIDRHFSQNKNGNGLKPIIIYHGSEPLLMKEQIFSSIGKFKDRFHFGIQSNGLLLDRKDVSFLKSHKVSIGISLDSFDEEVNNHTRRSHEGGNYNKAVRAIEWFNGYKGLNVITTITKFNVQSLPKLVSFLHSKKVRCVLLNPVRATRKSTVKLRPSHKDLSKYFIRAVKEAMRLSRESKREIIIANFSNIILGIVAPQARRLMCDISPCGGGRCFFAITASGEMIPCGEFIALKEFYGGNIFKTSINKAISSEPFRKVRSRVVEKIIECDTCIYRNICGAPCPAELYSLSKDMNIKSPYCEFYKEVIKYAFTLIAEDNIKYLFRKNALKDIKYEWRVKR